MNLINIIFSEIFQFINEQEDYVGDHSAPNKEDSPMHDLSQTYPDDIYTYDAPRLYGDNYGDAYDREAISIIQSARNRPNKLIKIYRAIPNINKEIDNKIKPLADIYNYYIKWRFFPMKNSIVYALQDKYENLGYDEMNKAILNDINNQIIQLSLQKQKPLTINNGDWVTISKNYAKEHGISNLNNNYKIATKTVKASQLYTDGNSIFEWGYNL